MLTRLLPATLGLGVIIAGLVMWQVCTSRPTIRRARWIVAALTVYGAATFIYAAVVGVTLPDTLSGAATHAVPYVLQGVFVGAFVILPLGWAVSALRASFPRFRSGSGAAAVVSQALALTACMLLLFTSLRGLERPHHRTPEDRLAALDRSLRAVEDSERESPRDRWDPDYVVSVVGRDPEHLFAWVRDNTFWIPYRGVLRGPIGVLMDRQGNSLDRAILLAMLLERAGQTVRLAHGELPQDNIPKLLPDLVARRRVYAGEVPPLSSPATAQLPTVAGKQTMRPDAVTPRDHADDFVASHYEPVADAIGMKFKVQERALTDAADALRLRVVAETAGLLAGLERPNAGNEWGDRLQTAVTALRDHWWVQMQDGQGWTDFDLLSAAHDNAPLASAIETMPINSISSDLYQQIVIRVVTEQWSEAALTSHKALEYTINPADVMSEPIVLQFWPTAWLSDFSRAGPRHTLLDAAAQDQWAAALSIGTKPVARAFLIESGAAAQDRPKGGDFGALMSSAATDLAGDSRRQTELTAVWVEYEIRVPGEQSQTVRRTVFDLLGPDARATGRKLAMPLNRKQKLTRGLSLMMRTEIEPMNCAVSPEYVQHMVAQSFLANRKLLSAIARDNIREPDSPAEGSSGPSNTPEKLLLQAAPPVSPLLALAAARLQTGFSPKRAFINRPNIITLHDYFAPAGEQVAVMEAIDIATNEVEVDLASPDAFPIRLWQGVLDTNLEARATLSDVIGNVAEAFASAKDWRVLRSSQRADFETRLFPPDVRRGITQALDAGYVVVAPHAPVQQAGEQFVGWWRINPSTGDTIGVAVTGWGQSITERASLADFANVASARFSFGFAMCQFGQQAMNVAWRLNETVFAGWHPHGWPLAGVKLPKSKLPSAIVKENVGGCLIDAITEGLAATLPLFLMTLRARGMELAAEELDAAAAAAGRRALERVGKAADLERTQIVVTPLRSPLATTLSGQKGMAKVMSLEEAKANAARAASEYQAAQNAAAAATGKWIRDGLLNNEKGGGGFDPLVHFDNEMEMNALSHEADVKRVELREAREEYDRLDKLEMAKRTR